MSMVSNDKIEKYLDELSLEYRELLFKALVERSESVDDLRISELLRIDNEIKKPLLENTSEKKQKRFRTLGLAYIFIGICLAAMSWIVKQISVTPTLSNMFLLCSLILVMVGGLAMLMSVIFPNKILGKNKTDNTNNDKMLQYEVISLWRSFEGMFNDAGVEMNDMRIPYIMNNLVKNQAITENEMNDLKSLLKARNAIIHSIELNYSSKDLEEIIAKVKPILAKLEKLQ